jgi:glycosyltransferase involved in cell wall biosynthesis
LLTDAAVAVGLVPARGLRARLGRWLEALSFRSADAVVALGPCMAARLRGHGVDPRRLHVLGVWADAREVPATPPGSGPLRAELDLAGRFVVMYSGNAGLSHDFRAACAAMDALADDDRFVFLFAGGGRRLPELREHARRRGLANVRFLPYFPRERLGEALGLADAHLVTLRRGLEGVVVPCKLYGAMAAARPVLFVGPAESTAALEVRRAGAGLCLAPEDGAGLAAALRRLADDPPLAHAMGRRGRAFFETEHERGGCCARWEALLLGLAGRTDGGAGAC